MFCGKCGARLNDSAHFCAFCGEPTAQFRVVDKAHLSQRVSPPSAPANQDKARKIATAALILGIISIVLSLIFAPFIYSIFAKMSISMSTDEWVLAVVTIFLYLVFKMLLALFEGMLSAIVFILPCVVLHTAGLIMAMVSRCKYKETKRSNPAMFVNAGASLLQFIILAICIGRNSIQFT